MNMYFILSLNGLPLITVITPFQPKMHPQFFDSSGEPKEVFLTQSCGFSKCLLVWNLPSSQMDLSLTAGHSQQRPSPRPCGFTTTSGCSLLRMAGQSWTRCDSCLVNRNCRLSHSWIQLKCRTTPNGSNQWLYGDRKTGECREDIHSEYLSRMPLMKRIPEHKKPCRMSLKRWEKEVKVACNSHFFSPASKKEEDNPRFLKVVWKNNKVLKNQSANGLW